MFVIGATGFTVASLACALATAPAELIAFRAVEGAFGAMLLPQGLGIIKSVFPPTETGKAFSLFGPIMGLSAVGGPILAGALIGLDAWGTQWRLIFLINLPLGVAAVFGALSWMPRDRPRPGVVIDLLSALLLGTALLLAINALILGPERHWPLWTWLSFAAAALLLAVFTIRERRARHPLIAPALLRVPSFRAGLLVMLGFFAGLSGLMLTLSVFTQGYLGFSAFRSGLTLAPMALGMAISAILLSGLVATHARRLLGLGLVFEALAVLALAVVVRVGGADVGFLALCGPGLAIGLGMGAVAGSLFDLVLAGVSEEDAGSGSGVLTAVQALSGSVGIAVITTVYLACVGSRPVPQAMAISMIAVAGVLGLSALAVRLIPARPVILEVAPGTTAVPAR